PDGLYSGLTKIRTRRRSHCGIRIIGWKNPASVIPAKAGIQFVEFRSFPINSYCFSFLDSHFRGNDGISVSVRTNVCAGMTKPSARKPTEMRQLPFARNTTRRFQMLSKKTEIFKK
ncbi:TPA: hypothetical protein ACKWXQ_002198, partial [Neisseria gonorrhoeae]